MGKSSTLITMNLNIMKYSINRKGSKQKIKDRLHDYFMEEQDCKILFLRGDICEIYTDLQVHRIYLQDLCRLYFYVQVEYFNVQDIEKREINLFNIKRVYKQPK